MITVTEEYVNYHSCLEKNHKTVKACSYTINIENIKVHYRNLYDDVTWSVEVLNKMGRRKQNHNLLEENRY